MKEGKAQSADERKPDKPETTEVIDPERLRTRSGEINNQGFNIICPDGKSRYYGNGG